jgi:AICAR transformylase/IMP cyclohydrolase PurH
VDVQADRRCRVERRLCELFIASFDDIFSRWLTGNQQFPFTDNVYRTAKSGVKYIAAPGGSQNDGPVFETAEKLGITFVEQSIRLFHH